MIKHNASKVTGLFMLFSAAIIWGVTFVAQDVGMNYIGPFTFGALRMAIATLVLIPLAVVFERKVKDPTQTSKSSLTAFLPAGLLCGIALFLGLALQQVGLSLYKQGAPSVGKAGFLSTLYIVFVPLFELFLGKKISCFVWIGIGISLAGMYLLCVSSSFTVELPDLLMVLSAVFVAVQILLVGRFASRMSGFLFPLTEFIVCGILFFVGMIITERPTWEAIGATLFPLLYVGILSSGVGFTFQILAQKSINPVVSSLIFSTEAVFAALAGWLILKQQLSPKELWGCILVFTSIIVCSLMTSQKEKQPSGVSPRLP